MSLLDDVSIVVTPNGYKAGELYAVVPVPTEGAEEVPSIIGILNLGGGTITQISGNSYSSTSDGTSGSGIRPKFDFNTTAGKRYKLTITPTGTISGTINFDFYDGSSYLFQNYDFTTTKEIYFIDNGSVFGAFDGTQTYNISSFTVSVKEYTSADMDVTRATAATRVDENGLVNYAEVLGGDLVVNGDFATDSDWSKAPSGVTISGGSANFNSASDTYVYQDILTATKTYKIIFSGTINSGSLYIGENGVATNIYTAGTYTNEVAYFNVASSARFIIRKTGVGTLDATIDNVSLKEVTRDNVPRIDYTGGGCPHILAEPQRTNLIPYSEDFSNSYWSKLDGLTVSSLTGGLSPDGLTNSDIITINNGRLNKDISVSNSTAYTLTAYFKGTVGETINMDLGASTRLITLTGLWQRESINLTTTSTFIAVNLIDNRSSGTASTVEVWGAQLEEGSYATSYIPTSGSTVTRNQDIFTRDGIGSLINSTEGVLFVEMASLSESGNYRELGLSDGTTSNRVLISYKSTDNVIRGSFQGSGGANLEYTVTSSKDFHKIAVKWKVNDFALWVDGVEVGSDTSGSSFPTDTLNSINFNSGSGGDKFLGKVKQLQVYKTALTDTQLAALTS